MNKNHPSPEKTCESTPEPGRQLPVKGSYDVIVCGAGPAGIAAALAAARSGAKTLLLERNGCLGGVWTSGLLCWIIDALDKPGLMREIHEKLAQRDARRFRVPEGRSFAYDIETMKLLLEELCEEAQVTVRLHTFIAQVLLDDKKNLTHVITESKSGREAFAGKVFIDCTGDGDLASHAGCGYDLGHPDTGETQPMSLVALLTGIRFSEIEPYVGGSMKEPKLRLRDKLQSLGVPLSYSHPTLFCVHDNLFGLMCNHIYGASALCADSVTAATLQSRREVNTVIEGLRLIGPEWKDVRLVTTAEHIGVREARRIHGHATVTLDDMASGHEPEDSVCRVNFGIDIHSTNPLKSTATTDKSQMPKIRPYGIPLRALIARDVRGLMMAGRCISGDFFAHSSYRVTGNAVVLGEAAGVAAALAARAGVPPEELEFSTFQQAREALHLKAAFEKKLPGPL